MPTSEIVLRTAILAVFSLSISAAAPATNRGPMHDRILCVVPMTGTGTWDDPKRPMFAPKPSEIDPANRAGILGWQWLPTDDGTMAIVEFVGGSPAALAHIKGGKLPGVQVFERGKHRRDDVERELKKLKKDFSLDEFLGRLK